MSNYSSILSSHALILDQEPVGPGSNPREAMNEHGLDFPRRLHTRGPRKKQTLLVFRRIVASMRPAPSHSKETGTQLNQITSARIYFNNLRTSGTARPNPARFFLRPETIKHGETLAVDAELGRAPTKNEALQAHPHPQQSTPGPRSGHGLRDMSDIETDQAQNPHYKEIITLVLGCEAITLFSGRKKLNTRPKFVFCELSGERRYSAIDITELAFQLPSYLSTVKHY
ncbi:hypothetical protein B0H14DRAFT_2573517 [Mycena olivaceomarginata]|nr:hypothetical protein B0H14DRAFT_2573517 [Mycena olivaceomarginata]